MARNQGNSNENNDENDERHQDLFGSENEAGLHSSEESGENLFGDDLVEQDDDYEDDLDEIGDYDPFFIEESVASQQASTVQSEIDDEEFFKNFQNEYGDLQPRRRPTKGTTKHPKMFSASQLSESETTTQSYRQKSSGVPSVQFSEIPSRGGFNYQDHGEVLENLEDTKGHPVKEWVMMDSPRNEIMKRFRKFLMTFTKPNSNGEAYYLNLIKQMIRLNDCSIEVDYNYLASVEHVLAFFLPEAPKEVISIFDNALTDYVFSLYPNYARIQPKICSRISNLPLIEEIHMLRQLHLNQLVRVPGVVSSQSPQLPQLDLVKYDCVKCSHIIGPFTVEPSTNVVSSKEIRPNSCPECSSGGPFQINSRETIYRNYQTIKLQESPGSVPAGRLPRTKVVILTNDLVDKCRPGDEIEVTGIFKNNYDSSLNSQNGFPVFATVIEANHLLINSNKVIAKMASREEIAKMNEVARDPDIIKRIIHSIAPSIYGHEDIKTAIALSLFGGESKNIKNKHTIRGDINTLLCGDPGTAKSQFLRFVSSVAPRSVMTTGQGASAVGLTASVIRSPGMTGKKEFSLEAGALVLADKGICLIDEFDKMNDQDRTSIHEAMEQQTISISKAGIVATLKARCAVIAASNPIGGRYDSSLTFMDNVDLSEPILSRFDILCVVQDKYDPLEDGRLAAFVCDSHIASHPQTSKADRDAFMAKTNSSNGVVKPFDTEFFQRYITYAREKCHPKFQQGNKEKISKMYSVLRKESQVTNSIPITVRHIESIIRISEAFAKMHLRDYVNDEDINRAMKVGIISFIQTQKYSVMSSMRRMLKKYLEYGTDDSQLMLHMLKKIVNEKIEFENNISGSLTQKVSINGSEFKSMLKNVTASKINEFLRSDLFRRHNFVHDQEKDVIVFTV